MTVYRHMARLSEEFFPLSRDQPLERPASHSASILLTSWLPVLLLGFADYPDFRASSLLPHSVNAFVLCAVVALLPWYRNWRVVWAPFAIYIFQLIALNGMLVTLLRRPRFGKGAMSKADH